MKSINRNIKRMPSICMVGCDLTSDGGIASVVNSYHSANLRREKPLHLTLIKTSYYKNKPKIFEAYIFVMSLFKCFYLSSIRHSKIMHIHTSSDFSFMRKSIFVLFGKIFRKKIVLHIHASNFYEFFLSKNKIISKFCRFIFRYADIILVLCNDWKKKLENRYGLRNVIVLYNPIEIDKLHLEKTDKQGDIFLILFLGFLIESKGIRDIIELAKRFKANECNGIKIIIAGKGDLETFLIEYIRDYSLNQVIDFRGWVTGKEKKQLLSSGDILFLPSYKEGMPISILEAMASGLPVVATKIAGIPDLVEQGRNGYLFEPGDINGYYHCFKKLQKDKKKIAQMGLESLKIVRSFDADRIFEKLVHIYNKFK